MPVNRRQFLFLLSSIALYRVRSIGAQPVYSESIAALRTAYVNEIRAHRNYLAYAERAKREDYSGIAHLFISFAASESIHAANFGRILSALGEQDREPPEEEVKVFRTKVNLANALASELKEIDHKYPQIYEKSKPENHEAAIRTILHAWNSEKQHRDLIQKAQSGTGIFFGILSSMIESASIQYFVCQGCGSTVIELPETICHICLCPVSRYKEVQRSK